MADFDEQLGISNEMKAEKRALMAESSHTFFRASPALFYHDLKTTYSKASRLLDTPAPNVPIVGDLHFGNSGTFRGPEGKAVWGFNDFDQAEAKFGFCKAVPALTGYKFQCYSVFLNKI